MMATLLATAAGAWPGRASRAAPGDGLIAGIVWQPDETTLDPRGSWHRIGARQLLVQWIVADGEAFVAGTGLPTSPRLPDWRRIAGEPWAREVIVGLAGQTEEPEARENVEALAELSRRLAALKTPMRVAGWYFPVEADPSWTGASRMAALLSRLPRPLWISVYDNANIGGAAMADWLDSWLPRDIGVFFQDGVGLHTREPAIARHYADALLQRLGPHRLRVVAEAFRPKPGGEFRPATADELLPQLRAYAGHVVYLFDGPHYVPENVVEELSRRAKP
jgi:hypothetical protein